MTLAEPGSRAPLGPCGEEGGPDERNENPDEEQRSSGPDHVDPTTHHHSYAQEGHAGRP